MRYKIEARAVDDHGNGCTWELRDANGVLPNDVERTEMVNCMSNAFHEIFHHNASRTGIGWVPSCGVDSPHKIAPWTAIVEDPRGAMTGLWVEEMIEPPS